MRMNYTCVLKKTATAVVFVMAAAYAHGVGKCLRKASSRTRVGHRLERDRVDEVGALVAQLARLAHLAFREQLDSAKAPPAIELRPALVECVGDAGMDLKKSHVGLRNEDGRTSSEVRPLCR